MIGRDVKDVFTAGCVIRGFPGAFVNTHWEKEPCDHFKAADVAPRAEVAREIFEEIEDDCLAYPIQEGHPTILVDARSYDALKKKYTKAEPPRGEA